MNSKTLAITVIVVIILIVAVFLLLGGQGSRSILSPGGTDALSAVEVRAYQGNDLSSINDFRENSIRGPQYVNTSDYRLTVTGLTNKTDVYTYQDVLTKYPHYTKIVTLFCVEGWDVTILWEGVLVRDLLAEARVKENANTIIFYAYDGYSTSFPLDYVLNNDILMADKMNNLTLLPERGFPFELVAENKWGYKWIKWITRIEISNDSSYKGYWERGGYSQSGDVDKPMFD